MSLNEEMAEYIQDLKAIETQNRILISAAALLVYEYAITLRQEIDFMWRSGNTKISMAIFFSNRSIFLVTALSYVLIVVPSTSVGSAKSKQILFLFATDASRAAWAAFSALWVYAVCKRQWPLAISTLLLSLLPVAADVTSQAYLHFVVYENVVSEQSALSTLTMSRMEIATRTCIIASDVLMIVVTWYSFYGSNSYLLSTRGKLSLAQLLTRDGLLNFTLLLILNVIGVVLYYTKRVEVYLAITSGITGVTVIFISRTMLNIREIYAPHDHDEVRSARNHRHRPSGYSRSSTSTVVSQSAFQMHPLKSTTTMVQPPRTVLSTDNVARIPVEVIIQEEILVGDDGIYTGGLPNYGTGNENACV